MGNEIVRPAAFPDTVVKLQSWSVELDSRWEATQCKLVISTYFILLPRSFLLCPTDFTTSIRTMKYTPALNLITLFFISQFCMTFTAKFLDCYFFVFLLNSLKFCATSLPIGKAHLLIIKRRNLVNFLYADFIVRPTVSALKLGLQNKKILLYWMFKMRHLAVEAHRSLTPASCYALQVETFM